MNIGFTTEEHPKSPRLITVTLDQTTARNFSEQINDFGIQAIEYKPFLRFKIADILNEITNKTLSITLQNILKDRHCGALYISYETNDYNNDVFNVLLSTAKSHLVGLPTVDPGFPTFYSRLTLQKMKHENSEENWERMELHTDGPRECPSDWVLMQKLASKNIKGGDSLLLHVDDWQELDKFYNHPLANKDIQWGPDKVPYPVFLSQNGLPCISFIHNLAEPENMEQGLYLHGIAESLEEDTNTVAIDIPVGGILLINNLRWLHGRDIIQSHENLYRELLRQRGVFFP